MLPAMPASKVMCASRSETVCVWAAGTAWQARHVSVRTSGARSSHSKVAQQDTVTVTNASMFIAHTLASYDNIRPITPIAAKHAVGQAEDLRQTATTQDRTRQIVMQ